MHIFKRKWQALKSQSSSVLWHWQKLTYSEFTYTLSIVHVNKSKIDKQSQWSLLINFLRNCVFLCQHIVVAYFRTLLWVAVPAIFEWIKNKSSSLQWHLKDSSPGTDCRLSTLINYCWTEWTEEIIFSEENEYTKNYLSISTTAQEQNRFKIHKSFKIVSVKVTPLTISCLVWKAFLLWGCEWS